MTPGGAAGPSHLGDALGTAGAQGRAVACVRQGVDAAVGGEQELEDGGVHGGPFRVGGRRVRGGGDGSVVAGRGDQAGQQAEGSVPAWGASARTV